MGTPSGVGIVGAGVIFRDHAAAWRGLSGRARMVGLAELNESKRREGTAENFIPLACGDFRELLRRDDIDIIDICTPPAFHEEIIRESLAAGKYVICEKPLAANLAAADRIIADAERYPGKLSVVYQLRYLPEIRKMIHLRDQGLLGKPLFAHVVRFGSLAGSSAVRSGWWGSWQTAGGGVVMTQFIHHLDQLCFLLGEPVEVSAAMETLKEPIESEDSFSATIRFAQGAIATCSATVTAQHHSFAMDLIGEQMSVHLPWGIKCGNPGTLQRAMNRLQQEFPAEQRIPQSRWGQLAWKVARRLKLIRRPPAEGNTHYPYFNAVLNAIRDKGPLPISAAEARRSLELCTAIYASSISGEPVKLPLDLNTPGYHGITPELYASRTRETIHA